MSILVLHCSIKFDFGWLLLFLFSICTCALGVGKSKAWSCCGVRVDSQDGSQDSTLQALSLVLRSSKGVFTPLSSQSCVAQGLRSEQNFLALGHANGSLQLERMHVLTGGKLQSSLLVRSCPWMTGNLSWKP